jgi:hypothetical protein
MHFLILRFKCECFVCARNCKNPFCETSVSSTAAYKLKMHKNVDIGKMVNRSKYIRSKNFTRPGIICCGICRIRLLFSVSHQTSDAIAQRGSTFRPLPFLETIFRGICLNKLKDNIFCEFGK